MKKYIFIILTLLLTCGSNLSGQKVQESYLINVDGHNTSADEFLWMYRKNRSESDTSTLRSYLEGYIIFRLKVASALEAGIDTTKAFKQELKGYRDLLARNYLTDNSVRDKLVAEAYKKSLTEINASHILVSVPGNALPADTMSAFEKVMSIRSRIEGGELFEDVARGSSDDPSVINNGGNLGYFTIFQLHPVFEAAAYSLRKGELSMPVRTSFGYHLIKVNDRRPAAGRLKTAHIMKVVAPGATLEMEAAAKASIDSLYNVLLQGGDFATLAKEFSDHRESAVRGGELPLFGTGEMIKEYADAAVNLKANGDISKPVRSFYGYHIIKRIDHQPHPSLEEYKTFIETRLGESIITAEGRRSLAEALKTEFEYKLNREAFNWFLNATTPSILAGDSCFSVTDIPKGVIFSFTGGSVTNSYFANYICNRNEYSDGTMRMTSVSSLLDELATDRILDMENRSLERKYPEFRYLVNEFHDGILLFEITEQMVWSKAQKDSTGLRAFYDANRTLYTQPAVMEGEIVIPGRRVNPKKIDKALRRLKGSENPARELEKQFGSDGDKGVRVESFQFSETDNDIPGNLKWKKGVYKTEAGTLTNYYFINSIRESEIQPFENVRGLVISGFQEFLEREWVEQLKSKYSVTVNNILLREIE